MLVANVAAAAAAAQISPLLLRLAAAVAQIRCRRCSDSPPSLLIFSPPLFKLATADEILRYHHYRNCWCRN
ncbi:unnamed protein product [Cuscuta campestris]|uniref:Uncharacterized protein n=1 Tax=Cuscuta campestris TaxID=132261 RepID=A0A484MMP6_9ASTE|nr:unnamed protein product [Cuscuta campestris]